MKPGISAVVIVYNQVELLKKCLDSVKDWVDEIIIVDLESTDDIKSVAKKYQATYHALKKVTIVEQVRQKSLEYVDTEYVLFLDPDETISPSLAKRITEKLETHPACIKTPRANYIFGQWMEHTLWWPDYQARICQKTALTWPTTLHAQPQITGEVITLSPVRENAIEHLNYVSIDEWIDKNKRYAKANAEELLTAKTPFTFVDAMKKSIGEITGRFFGGHGYADGMHGLMLSVLQSFYYFLVYAYYWEGKKYAELETGERIKQLPRVWFSHGLSEILFWDKSVTGIRTIKNKLVRRFLA